MGATICPVVWVFLVMADYRFEYEVSVPQTVRGMLSPFKGKSPV